MHNLSISNQLNTIYPIGSLTEEERALKIEKFSSMNLFERACFFTGNFEEFKPAKKLLSKSIQEADKFLPELVADPTDILKIDIKKSSPKALTDLLISMLIFENTDKNCISILSANKIDVNFVLGEVTLLRISAAQINFQIVDLLIKNGADVKKSSPLRSIARDLPTEKHADQLEIAKALIQNGAPVLHRFQGVIFKEGGYSLAELTFGADLKSLPPNCAHNKELKALFDKQIELRKNLNYVLGLKILQVKLLDEVIQKIAAFVRELICNDL